MWMSLIEQYRENHQLVEFISIKTENLVYIHYWTSIDEPNAGMPEPGDFFKDIKCLWL